MTHLRGCAIALSVFVVSAGPSAVAQGLSDSVSRAAQSAGKPAVQARTMEVRDVTFGDTAASRKIGRILVTGLTRSGDRVHADRIDLENIIVKFATHTAAIPAVVISGADLPAPLFRALTEGDASIDWAGQLMQSAIERISIERITQSDAATHAEVIDKNFLAAGLKDGIVASARVGEIDAVAPVAPGSPEQVKLHMGEIRYEQLNLGESLRFFTGGGSGGAKRLLQRAVVDGIGIVTPDAVITIGRLELAAIDGRAPSQGFPAALQLQAGLPGASPSAEAQAQSVAYVSDLLRDLRIGRYSIERISVAAQGRRFAVNGITMSGFSSRGLERFEINGVDIPIPGSSVRFDRFELKGLSYGSLLDAALDAARSGGSPELPPEKIAQVMPRLASLQLSRLDVQTPQAPVSLADLRYDFAETADNTSAELALNEFRFDIDRSEPNAGRDKMMALGFDKVRMDANLRVRWLPQDHSFAVENLGLAVDRAGRVDIHGRLDNLDLAKAMADPTAAQQVLNAAQLGPLEMRLVNLGLAERFYAQTAKDAGVSPEAMRAGFAQEMRARAVAQFGPALTAHSADAIAAFLQAPGSINARLTAAPGTSPISLGEVEHFDPPTLMQRLRLSLDAAKN